jgi:molybdopterin converting factor small subunit
VPVESSATPLVTVALPASLTAPQCAEELPCEAATVRDALQAVIAARPILERRLLFEGRPLVSVIHNGAMLPPHTAMATELTDGDRVELLPPVAGG